MDYDPPGPANSDPKQEEAKAKKAPPQPAGDFSPSQSLEAQMLLDGRLQLSSPHWAVVARIVPYVPDVAGKWSLQRKGFGTGLQMEDVVWTSPWSKKARPFFAFLGQPFAMSSYYGADPNGNLVSDAVFKDGSRVPTEQIAEGGITPYVSLKNDVGNGGAPLWSDFYSLLQKWPLIDDALTVERPVAVDPIAGNGNIELIVSAKFMVLNYQYIHFYQFFDDGRIEMGVTLCGRLNTTWSGVQNGATRTFETHLHHLFFKAIPSKSFFPNIAVDALQRKLTWVDPLQVQQNLQWFQVQTAAALVAAQANVTVNGVTSNSGVAAVRFRGGEATDQNIASLSAFEAAVPSLVIDVPKAVADPSVTDADFFVLPANDLSGLGEAIQATDTSPTTLIDAVKTQKGQFLGPLPAVWVVLRHWHFPRQVPEDPFGNTAKILPYHAISFTVTPSGIG